MRVYRGVKKGGVGESEGKKRGSGVEEERWMRER